MDVKEIKLDVTKAEVHEQTGIVYESYKIRRQGYTFILICDFIDWLTDIFLTKLV